MSTPKKTRKPASQRTTRGPNYSGPSIPDAQRKRPALRVTLSPEALTWLEAEQVRTEESRSALLDALVLTGRPDAYLPPALLEELATEAAARGRTVHEAITDAVDCWLCEVGQRPSRVRGRERDATDRLLGAAVEQLGPVTVSAEGDDYRAAAGGRTGAGPGAEEALAGLLRAK